MRWLCMSVFALFAVTGGALAVSAPFNGKIAFVTERDGNSEIYVMNENGSGLARLTVSLAAESQPAWSPDGRRIAFIRAGSLFTMSANGSVQTLVQGAFGSVADPSWSPDGTQIAFQSLAFGDIFVISAEGGNPVQLTSDPGTDSDPSWSADGHHIVFASNRDGNSEIYVMNSDGSGQTRLTVNPAFDQQPRLSPDGKKIAFVRFLDARHRIFSMNADGSGLVQLASLGDNFELAFSPDGRKIAFVSDRDGGNHEIYTMDADGSDQVRRTVIAAREGNPAWQPLFRPDTIGVYRRSSGQWLLRNSNSSGAADLTLNFGGQPGDLPVAGDWNGDGRTDIGVFRSGTFVLGVLQSTFPCPVCREATSVSALAPFSFGQAGDVPIAGDWDGDGVDEVGVYRNGALKELSTFLLRERRITVFQPCATCPPIPQVTFETTTHHFGESGDLPVAGDWDGDRKDTIGVFHAGVFLLTNDFSEANTTVTFGLAEDLPFAGDWLGLGHDRAGVFDPVTGTMTLNIQPGNAFQLFVFGSADDIPVAGHWTPAP